MGQSMHKGSLCSAVVEVLYQNTNADRGSVGAEGLMKLHAETHISPGGEQDLSVSQHTGRHLVTPSVFQVPY